MSSLLFSILAPNHSLFSTLGLGLTWIRLSFNRDSTHSVWKDRETAHVNSFIRTLPYCARRTSTITRTVRVTVSNKARKAKRYQSAWLVVWMSHYYLSTRPLCSYGPAIVKLYRSNLSRSAPVKSDSNRNTIPFSLPRAEFHFSSVVWFIILSQVL